MPDEGIYLLSALSMKKVRNIRSQVINEIFSDEEKVLLSGSEFNIILYINSETGRIDDVCYNFDLSDPFAYIPVSTYRKLELELKENIAFELTDEGRKLNYIFYWFEYKF